MLDLCVFAVGLVATVMEEPTIPIEFQDLFAVFSEDEACNLADHGPKDLSIDL
jgi:hypothetical protein